MAEKFKEQAVIISQEEIAPAIYSLWIKTDKIAQYAKAGQFISIYCEDGSRLLPRPISICEIDKEDCALHLVYRIAGAGTEEFSQKQTGDYLSVMGPLGNGFPLKSKKAFLIGGGIGACLACVCKSKEVDGHTNVHNKRVCKEGPVFLAEEVEL